MEHLASTEQLEEYRDRLRRDRNAGLPTIVIPAGTCGRASGAEELATAARRSIGSRPLRLRITGCHGYCQAEPSVLVEPWRFFYPKVRPQDMDRIVTATEAAAPVEDLLFTDPSSHERIARQEDLPFYRRQVRTILSWNEKVDPTDIVSYVEHGGYTALAKALRRRDPGWVVLEVKSSGLRGRGGAGFPTGAKWEMLARQPAGRGKFVVCNADEGDPGAYMDRSVLEGDPHRIIEGMVIGALATGANEGIVYVRHEYPLAIQHLTLALEQARGMGLLGSDILGSGLSFDIATVIGAGAFVCGEETALIRSIEGKVGEPRQRPPFPIERGIEGRPTCINNVETWANIPEIIAQGAVAFAAIGTPGSAGTKIFSLVGKVANTGLVEVPMGMSIREIVEDIGGGSVGEGEIKAVQTGGPSGGCIPAQRFDLPIDYDSLAAAGSIMGSGGMIVMDERTCMVDVAKYFMRFLKDESCGKCFTCRKGTQRMHEILEDITRGRGSREHLVLLDELARTVRDTTLCGLGQTAANPVLSTLQYFRDEYLEHIERRRCPAGVCKDLIAFSISDLCTGCQTCVKACPGKAIQGTRKQRHVILADRCIRCGVCRSVCTFNAIVVT